MWYAVSGASSEQGIMSDGYTVSMMVDWPKTATERRAREDKIVFILVSGYYETAANHDNCPHLMEQMLY